MFTDRKRKNELLLIAILMNIVLFVISYSLNLPLWLDTTGTIYISCLLGAPLGYLCAIINNVFEAVFFFGEDSLVFYLVSMLTAFLAGRVMGAYRHTKVKKWLIMTLVLLLADGAAAVVITLIANNGIPSNYWSGYIYDLLLAEGLPSLPATALAVLAVKVPDVIVSVWIVMLAIRLTPQRLKTKKMIILNSPEEFQ